MKPFYQIICALLFVAGVATPGVLAQRVLFVDAAAGGAGDGSAWADAFTDVQDALAAAAAGDEIWVAEGIYKPIAPADSTNVTDAERDARFQLKNGVRLYGGFAGDETDRDARDAQARPTILSGDLLGNDDGIIDPDALARAENSWHVVVAGDVDLGPVDSTAVLDGFVITGGNANEFAPNPNDAGGGLFVFGSQTTFSEPTVRNVVFTANTARFGGGLGCIFSAPTLSHVVFIDNTVTSNGGGMLNAFCASTLRNVLFRDNRSGNFGGGLMNDRGATLMNGVTFIGNTGIWGGGMYNRLENAVVVSAAFFSNVADVSGGGMYNDDSPTAVMNAVFSGNRTLDATRRGGGGMGNFNSINDDPFLTNVVFYGNTTARDGGAIFNINSDPTLVNSILWQNQADGQENELFNGGLLGSTPLVVASLIEGGLPVGVTDGGGNLDADPLFVDADGPDDLPGTPDDDVRLTAGSPAIDAGNNQGLLFDVLDLDRDGDTTDRVSVDLDGNLRVHDAGGGLFVDLGAYEFNAPGVLVAAEDAAVDLPDAPLFLAAYPNPFREQATLRYALPASGRVTIKVYDMLGRETATLVDGVLPAGTHTVHFEAPHLASGVYLYRLETAGHATTRKMLLVK